MNQHTEQPSEWMQSFRNPYRQAKMYAGEYCTTQPSGRVMEVYRLNRRRDHASRVNAFFGLGMQYDDAVALLRRFDKLLDTSR